ncbi:unnamed protein product [Somion occarium]|uniref:Fungal-type protein kinase domain-containing protein n=1 Tax=Somion occarium TaxID=3059160 RepID=A0ABP1E5C3_9APHY
MIASLHQEDVNKWFSDWLPGRDDKLFNFDDVTFKKKSDGPTNIRVEKDLYKVLCPVIQNVFDLAAHRSSGNADYDALHIKDTSVWKEESDYLQCPDLSIHRTSAAEAFCLDDKSKKNVVDAHKCFVGRTAYSWTLLPGEIKVDKSKEGFGTTPTLDLPDTDDARQTRGQFAEYVTEILSRQHRRFTFAFYIYRNLARLFVVDRVAAVMTPPFDYIKTPMTLLKFFYRLAEADAWGLGYDPTAVLASPSDISILRDHKLNHGAIQTFINDAVDGALNHDLVSLWPLYKVEVCDHKLKKKSYFLIGKPRTPGPSMFGRATKGFVAFDLVEHDFVWLKDSWRVVSEHSHPEWEVYERLKSSNVQNIATIRCGGDVHDCTIQSTSSQDLITGCRLKGRIHSRLVINEIGFPLETYETSFELIFIVLSAFIAHEQAWKKAHVLHRDISKNNMLILHGKNGTRGLLIDWDLCKYEDEVNARTATNVNRSGTWQFISALRLQYPKKYYEVADDIESFVHVITWHALRYHHHDLLGMEDSFTIFVHDMFLQCSTSPEGLLYGCHRKWESMRSGEAGFKLISDEKLQKVIDKLMRICKSHYQSLNLDELEKFRPPSIREAVTAPEGQNGSKGPSELRKQDLGSLLAIISAASVDDNHTHSDGTGPGSTTTYCGRTLDNHTHIFEVLVGAIQDSDGWSKETKPIDRDYFAKLLDVNLTAGRRTIVGTQSHTTSSQKRSRPPQVPENKKTKWSRTSRSGARAVGGNATSTSELAAVSEEDDVDCLAAADDGVIEDLQGEMQVGSALIAHQHPDEALSLDEK